MFIVVASSTWKEELQFSRIRIFSFFFFAFRPKGQNLWKHQHKSRNTHFPSIKKQKEIGVGTMKNVFQCQNSTLLLNKKGRELFRHCKFCINLLLFLVSLGASLFIAIAIDLLEYFVNLEAQTFLSFFYCLVAFVPRSRAPLMLMVVGEPSFISTFNFLSHFLSSSAQILRRPSTHQNLRRTHETNRWLLRTTCSCQTIPTNLWIF